MKFSLIVSIHALAKHLGHQECSCVLLLSQYVRKYWKVFERMRYCDSKVDDLTPD